MMIPILDHLESSRSGDDGGRQHFTYVAILLRLHVASLF